MAPKFKDNMKLADATHYADDAIGRMYYKRCEVNNVWLFWCVSEWQVSNSAKREGFKLTPIPKEGAK